MKPDFDHRTAWTAPKRPTPTPDAPETDAPPHVALDDAGRRILAVDFNYPRETPAERATREATMRFWQERTIGLLQMLATGTNARKVGLRVIALCFLLGQYEGMSQAKLAKKLNVTPGRLSQMLAQLRAGIALLPES